MVVDDDDAFRESLCCVIEDWRFNCTSISGGEEALKYLSANTVDLVLLDIRMPGMSGIECLEQIRRIHPELRVLLMTAYSDQIALALELGALAVLSKPLKLESLLPILERHTKKSLIVVVDSDPAFSRDFQTSLKERVLSVLAASDIDEALGLVYRESPDVIVLDMAFPRENTVRAMKELRKAVPSISMVVISDFKEELALLAKEAAKERIMVLFAKPLKMPEFLNILSKVFEGEII